MSSHTTEGPVLRPVGAILGRAALAGLGGGAVLAIGPMTWAALVDRSEGGVLSAVLVAGVVGALIGVVVAVPTSLAWILLTELQRCSARMARWATSVTAGLLVVAVSVVLTGSVTWFVGGYAAVACLVAYLLGPRIGYRRWRPAVRRR